MVSWLAEGRLVRMHPSQYACDLLGRMALPQQRAIAARHGRTPPLLWLGSRIAPAIAPQFTTNRTRRVLYAAGNCSQRTTLLKTQLNHRAFFTTQMFVIRSHRNALPPGMCCISYLRPLSHCCNAQRTILVIRQKGKNTGARQRRRPGVFDGGHARMRAFAGETALRGPNCRIATRPADKIQNA